MKNFKPDYNKCNDERKEIYHNICKNNKKDTYMMCNLYKDLKCKAWEGYKHEFCKGYSPVLSKDANDYKKTGNEI